MDELRPGHGGPEPGRGLLGDIVLCPQVATRQAKAAGHAPIDELLLLTTHGILHLLGYDHAEPEEEQEMFELQRELLVGFSSRTATARPWRCMFPQLSCRGPRRIVIACLLAAAEAAIFRMSRRHPRSSPTRAAPARVAADRRRRLGRLHLRQRFVLRMSRRRPRPSSSRSPWRPSTSTGGAAPRLAIMAVVSFVLVGVSARAPSAAQNSTRSPSGARAVAVGSAGCSARSPTLLVVLGNRVTPGRATRDGPFQTESELRDLVDMAGESEVIEDDEREMIHSVFELGDTVVREVMVPRTDMVVIEHDQSLRSAMSLFLRSGFSRIPVVGEDSDDVLGILYLKDVARRLNAAPDARSR